MIEAPATCGCAECARGHGLRIQLGDEVRFHAAGLFGPGDSADEQTLGMFARAEDLLHRAGMEFRDVVRTWIHLRDIDRDYDALNAARRELFRRRGIERRPASTGVQGIPFPLAHDCGMSLFAVRAPGSLEVATMSTPALNEAWSYGADFSRGLRVVDGNAVALHISGTASIDEEGRPGSSCASATGRSPATAPHRLGRVTPQIGQK